MKYREGRPEFRRYDACYYEILAYNPRALLEEIENKGEGLRIFVKFKKMTEMQVYIYEGPSKFSAKRPVVPQNEPASLDVSYSVDLTSGFLIVAIPNKDKDTEFDFEYWVSGYQGTPWYEMIVTWDFSDVGGTKVLTFFILALVVLTCAICCVMF